MRNQFRIPFHKGKYRKPLQAVSESNGGIRYRESKQFIRAGMYGADRNSGAPGEALRYAVGSIYFRGCYDSGGYLKKQAFYNLERRR